MRGEAGRRAALGLKKGLSSLTANSKKWKVWSGSPVNHHRGFSQTAARCVEAGGRADAIAAARVQRATGAGMSPRNCCLPCSRRGCIRDGVLLCFHPHNCRAHHIRERTGLQRCTGDRDSLQHAHADQCASLPPRRDHAALLAAVRRDTFPLVD